MTEEGQTKTCPICYSQIDLRARRCRFCAAGQDRMSGWFLRHSSLWWILQAAVILLLVAFIPVVLRSVFGHGEEFAAHRQEIRVVSFEMAFSDSNEGPMVYVVGNLHNDGRIAWKFVQVEAQFLDANGRMIDTARVSLRNSDAVLHPQDDQAFKIDSARDFPREQYATVKVFVRSARDARSLW